MAGDLAFGLACVAVRTHNGRKELLYQFWDIAWLYLKLPFFGRLYRQQVIDWMFERHPWQRDYHITAVRLGQGWSG